MSKEKRSKKRYVVSGLKARLREKRGLSKSIPTSKEYPCIDISEGGLQFASTHKFAPQNRITLDLSIPTTKNTPIRAKAQVVWFNLSEDLNFARVGLKFISIDKQGYANLKRLLKTSGKEKDKIHPTVITKKLK